MIRTNIINVSGGGARICFGRDCGTSGERIFGVDLSHGVMFFSFVSLVSHHLTYYLPNTKWPKNKDYEVGPLLNYLKSIVNSMYWTMPTSF